MYDNMYHTSCMLYHIQDPGFPAPHHCIPHQVLDFATRHKAFVVRGNHDEAAITAYEKLHRGEPIKVRMYRELVVCVKRWWCVYGKVVLVV